MKRILIIGVATLATLGCSELRELTAKHQTNAYDKPFYAKYLVTGSALDAQIQKDIDVLRQNPKSAETHNELGTLLVQKGFPRDAEREFERAVDVNGKYYPAWYNLGLVRAARGDEMGAHRAFAKTVAVKPGHPAALFQLGMVEEKRGHMDRAVDLYAKAFAINPSLLDVQVNPRILDSKLASLAVLKNYDAAHTRASMQFQGVPNLPTTVRTGPSTQQAPSPQAQPQNILTPSAPATDPSQHPSASTVAPAQQVPRRTSAPDTAAPQRPQRRRRPTNPAVPENQQQQPPTENPPKDH